MTTVVHIGDFHAAPGPRNADRYRALDQIIRESRVVDLWVWPGDLSHQRQTIDDKNAMASRLQAMAQRAPVIIVYGNHDLPGDLDVFAHLNAPYPIHVLDRPHCVTVRLANGQTATIFGLPYPTKAGLVAQGVVPADVVNVAADALEPIFMRAAGLLEEARAHGNLTLMVGHVNVAGSITSTGQPNIGREIELSPRHLDRLGPIYKGLNHIHKAQTIAGAHYAGSVCRLDWGEIDPKSYITVLYDDSGESSAWVVDRQPLDVAPMFHLEGELTRDGFTIDDDEFPPDLRRLFDWSGCEIRVRYRYRQSERAVLDERLVREPFLAAKYLKVEPVAVPDRAVRAPMVASALTLVDKVSAWADVVGITPAPTLVEKLGRLEHTDAAVLVADFTASLQQLEEPRIQEAVAP